MLTVAVSFRILSLFFHYYNTSSNDHFVFYHQKTTLLPLRKRSWHRFWIRTPDKSWPRNCELKPCCVQGEVSGCSQSKYHLQRESSMLLPQWGRKKFPTKFPRHIFIFGLDWPLVPQECKVTSQVGFSTKQGFCLFVFPKHAQ